MLAINKTNFPGALIFNNGVTTIAYPWGYEHIYYCVQCGDKFVECSYEKNIRPPSSFCKRCNVNMSLDNHHQREEIIYV